MLRRRGRPRARQAGPYPGSCGQERPAASTVHGGMADFRRLTQRPVPSEALRGMPEVKCALTFVVRVRPACSVCRGVSTACMALVHREFLSSSAGV